MTQRIPLIAANWKMNDPPPNAFADDSPYRTQAHIDVVVFPTFLDLERCASAGLITGAQCGRAEPSGAFTGDVSMAMLKGVGCSYVLCGHSDRRTFHRETNEDIALQAHAALDAQLIPIVCIGETTEEHKGGKAEEVIKRQLETVLTPLSTLNSQLSTLNSQLSTLNSQLIVAYEPVWAISRGDPSTPAATPEDAQRMHLFIRKTLSTLHSQLSTLRILYGGSMNADNARELLAEPDIDGGLIGGASLKPEEFRKIVECALQSA